MAAKEQPAKGADPAPEAVEETESKKHVWIQVELGGKGRYREKSKITTSVRTVLNHTKILLPPDEAKMFVERNQARYCEPLGD